MSKIIAHKTIPGIFVFRCPGCGRIHEPRSREYTGSGPKWDFNGDINNPTFNNLSGGSYSFLHQYPMKGVEQICHYYITNGIIQFLGDCTHPLKSQNITLPECNLPESYYS